MKNWKHDVGLRIVKAMAILLAAIPFWACWFGYYAQRIYVPFYAKGHLLIMALFVAVYTALARTYDAFKISVNRISEMIYSQGLAALMTDCVMFVVIWLQTRHFPALWPGLLALAAQILLATAWSMLAHQWYFASFPPRKSAIVFDMRHGIDDLIREYGLEKKFDIQFMIPVSECLEDYLSTNV